MHLSLAVALLVGLVGLSGAVLANEKKYTPVPKMNLPANFQIQMIPAEEPAPPQSLRQLCEGCETARNTVSQTLRALARKQRQCHRADYSRADQAAAGCTQNDTVAQCNGKLFNRCVKPEHDAYNVAISGVHRSCNALIESLRRDLNSYRPR